MNEQTPYSKSPKCKWKALSSGQRDGLEQKNRQILPHYQYDRSLISSDEWHFLWGQQ